MTLEPFYEAVARSEWSQVKRKASIERLLDRIRFHHKALIPFDEVRKRLKLRHPNYRGIQQIPINRIVL